MVSWGVKSAIFSIKFRRQKLRARRDERFVTGLIGTLSEMKPDSWEIFKFMQKLENERNQPFSGAENSPKFFQNVTSEYTIR